MAADSDNRFDSQLTPIEQMLLRTLSTGVSNKNMARHLGKSEFTVRNQLSTLFRKLNADNRVQAVTWYRENMEPPHERKR